MSEPPSKRHALNVLIVENHVDTSRYLRRYLEQLGHQVRLATTMAEGLEELAKQPCDFLLSDIGLPDGDGWQLLRKASLPPFVYTVAMSGFGMSSDQRESKAAGYRHHLLKPFTPDQLDGFIAEAVQEQVKRVGQN